MTKSTRRGSRVLDRKLLAAIAGGGTTETKETLASSVQKKLSETDAAVIAKI